MQSVTQPSAASVRAYLTLLSTAARLANAVDADLRRRVGLTHAQFEILSRVGENEEGLRMAELAERLVVSRSGLSYQVQQLEKSGLLERRRDDRDERGVIAELTPQGRDLIARATPGHVELVQGRVFGALDDAQLQELAGLLETISAALE